MYKIIGADGRQYGPVTTEQLRQWIAEGRARGETLVQVEGQTEWKPLNSIPEFASVPQTAPPAPPTLSTTPPTLGADSSVQARASNKIPAGICAILLGTLGVHKFILGYTGAGLILLLSTILTCGVAAMVTQIICLVEGIIYLCKSDEDFVRTYVDGRREWF